MLQCAAVCCRRQSSRLGIPKCTSSALHLKTRPAKHILIVGIFFFPLFFVVGHLSVENIYEDIWWEGAAQQRWLFGHWQINHSFLLFREFLTNATCCRHSKWLSFCLTIPSRLDPVKCCHYQWAEVSVAISNCFHLFRVYLYKAKNAEFFTNKKTSNHRGKNWDPCLNVFS